MIADTIDRGSYLEMQECVLRLLDCGVSHKVAILCGIGLDPKKDREITAIYAGISENHSKNTKILHGMRKRLHTILNTPFDREHNDVLGLDYESLAHEACNFPEEFDNYARVEWLNKNLGLHIRLVGELGCPTLMAPVDDWVSRERFRLFLGEFLAAMKAKNPDTYSDVPGYFEGLNIYRTNVIDQELERYTTLEKFDGFFSSMFFRSGIDFRQFYYLMQEYKSIPIDTSNNSRERALWILRKTGQNLFYTPDGNTPDPLIDGIPNNNSFPYWDRQTGLRGALDGFVCNNWAHFSIVFLVCDGVIAGGFYNEGAGGGPGPAGLARVPLLGDLGST